ncbi:glycosyltransferase family 2 protein [Zavarzinia sp. CC-PAN008]|uniref:glycosyltransferase family 2 protein n=1 Tax=Zavarzinia sp. CC-PAN008 TaxID=3243332 RepID=UPI003F748975
MCDVTVVLVNYNGGADLATALAHLARQTVMPRAVVVVDNASTDGSAEGLPPNVTLIRAGANLGFAAANNLAAQAADSEWLALLNPDAFPEPGWLEALMQATRLHPECSGFGSLQVQAADPTVLDGAGDCYHLSGVPYRGGYGHMTENAPPEGEVFAPCAAAALYRRSAFLAAGGFDADFFCYCEDVDLAFRLRLAGHRFRQVGDAVVRHVGSASTGRGSAFQTRLGYRNRLWTFAKDMPGPLLAPTLVLHVAATLVLLLRDGVRGRGGAALRGLGQGLAGLPAVLRKRRAVQATRTIGARALSNMMVWSLGALVMRLPQVLSAGSAPDRRLGG